MRSNLFIHASHLAELDYENGESSALFHSFIKLLDPF